MVRSLLQITTLLTMVGITACAGPSSLRQFQQVPPGKLYAGPLLNITAPQSEGWHLLKADSSGMAFGRIGSNSGESFAAQVATFAAPQTDSPEEFEALIVKGAQGDADPKRFRHTSFTHSYSSVRGYPCVQVTNISEDTQARTGLMKTETLILQNENLYCRHPAKKDLGFAVTYSHRGKELHPNFQAEAQSFTEGVQVPDATPSK